MTIIYYFSQQLRKTQRCTRKINGNEYTHRSVDNLNHIFLDSTKVFEKQYQGIDLFYLKHTGKIIPIDDNEGVTITYE